MDGWVDGQMDRWMDEWMNSVDTQINIYIYILIHNFNSILYCFSRKSNIINAVHVHLMKHLQDKAVLPFLSAVPRTHQMLKTVVEQKASVPSEGLKVTDKLELKDSIELYQLNQPYP